MKNWRLITFVGFSILLIASSCQTGSPESVTSSATHTDPPPEVTLQATEIPSFSEDTGAFRVRLVYQENGAPIQQRNFYLAEMLPVQGQFEGAYVPALDTITAPKDESNSEGEINISNVPPMKYALTFLTPLGPILVEDADTEKEITLEIFANQITDLGTITVLLDPDDFEP